ncbi:MAG TPA: lytic murein transglycosylase [Acidocella sp.]|jgi:membrane-bound lytic murein transglycosylase B|uniref:lytic murein transglycosylase n=1 Tax=Acidocella sp. TaxID=50710 RepID=UPI002CF3BE62|nr:lytic murein transglycosylase [Acidocella sp.]HVE21140.1 lytic murein transglycosylase [Acidocella sp.]
MDRRALLLGLPLTFALPRFARAADFSTFLASLQARAAAEGIPSSIIETATGHLVPNQTVLRLDRHQPEFTETWAEYSSHVLNQTRVDAGTRKSEEMRDLFAAVTSRFGVSAAPLLGIWGIETNYGTTQGDFNVIDALTTLAWDRNSRYFGSEVISALRIIAAGDAPAPQLIGSYAGAMGQPQFMPSVYLSTAISFSGNGRPDIWSSDADSIASIANYLAKAGWVPEEPSSEPVLAPSSLDVAMSGRETIRTVGYWRAQGVQRLADAPNLPEDMPAALLLPDGAGGQAFLLYRNFYVIRRYNASDFYALAVGALGRMAVEA